MIPIITLINPPLSLKDRYGKEIQKFGAVSEPLGLAYIAGYLEAKGFKVNIIDAQAENIGHEEVLQNIIEIRPHIIGISVLTPAFHSVKFLCESIKNVFTKTLIVLGGPHCTALPERTLEEIESADIVCMGEGELTMADICSAFEIKEWSKIKGICYRYNSAIVKNEVREFIKDLDSIPPPARHLLPMHRYHLTASRVAANDYCPTIIVARGCPFKCTYCSRTFGKSFRSHSVERIVSEIQLLIDTYHITQLNIEADTLTAKQSFLFELCSAMIKRDFPSKLSWTCESRVDTINSDMLKLMKKAGCWQISYGVETGSQRLLDIISKGVTIKTISNAFQLTKQAGISMRGFFMIGLPTETYAESLLTIDYAKKLDPLYAQFTITIPYPGTQMFNELDKNGEIRSYDWKLYNTWSGWKEQKEMPYIANGRSVEELCDLQKRAMRDFYLRPRKILEFICNVRSAYDLKRMFTGFLTLMKSYMTVNQRKPYY